MFYQPKKCSRATLRCLAGQTLPRPGLVTQIIKMSAVKMPMWQKAYFEGLLKTSNEAIWQQTEWRNVLERDRTKWNAWWRRCTVIAVATISFHDSISSNDICKIDKRPFEFSSSSDIFTNYLQFSFQWHSIA